MKYYKVQRTTDGLFWEGNGHYLKPFTTKGKVWKQLAHVKSAIDLYNRAATLAKNLIDCDIVEYEYNPIEVSRQKAV